MVRYWLVDTVDSLCCENYVGIFSSVYGNARWHILATKLFVLTVIRYLCQFQLEIVLRVAGGLCLLELLSSFESV